MSTQTIDPVTNDRVRGPSGDGGTAFLRSTGAEEIAQGCDVLLKFFEGEDPWNTTTGTKHLDLVMRKGEPISLVLGEFTRRILEQPGMIEVTDIEAIALDDRRISIVWTGTASIETLAQLVPLGGQTEIST